MGALAGLSGQVSSLAFSLDGRRIVSGSSDGLVKIWDAETKAEVSSFECVEGGEVTGGGVLSMLRARVEVEMA